MLANSICRNQSTKRFRTLQRLYSIVLLNFISKHHSYCEIYHPNFLIFQCIVQKNYTYLVGCICQAGYSCAIYCYGSHQIYKGFNWWYANCHNIYVWLLQVHILCLIVSYCVTSQNTKGQFQYLSHISALNIQWLSTYC